MSRAMTLLELSKLLNYVKENHNFFTTVCGKRIKYVHPNIDMRDGKCFSVNFRGWGREHVLHTAWECRDIPESLYDRCIEFLHNPEWP